MFHLSHGCPITLIDLHIHSTYSDGTFSPQEIVAAAQQRGIRVLSITDHDTMSAYPEVIGVGARHQVEVVPGIEITAHHQQHSLHILGYGLDPGAQALSTGLREIQQARCRRNEQILAKLQGFKIAIGCEDLPVGEGQVGRPHIARILMSKGVVRSEQEAFAKFLRKDGAAYVQRQLLPVGQAMRMIIEAGGLPVLAHPGSLKMDEAELGRVIQGLMAEGLAGVEVYHPMNGDMLRRFLEKITATCGLLGTGGSDFHGRIGDRAPLGESGKRRAVPMGLLPALKSRLRMDDDALHVAGDDVS